MFELRSLRVANFIRTEVIRLIIRVYCSREIAVSSVATLNGRAKVGVCCVMLVCGRKIAYRYAGMCISCSVDHYGPFFLYF